MRRAHRQARAGLRQHRKIELAALGIRRAVLGLPRICEPRARGQQHRLLDAAPALAAGRWGITARVIASPRSTCDGGLPK